MSGITRTGPNCGPRDTLAAAAEGSDLLLLLFLFGGGGVWRNHALSRAVNLRGPARPLPPRADPAACCAKRGERRHKRTAQHRRDVPAVASGNDTMKGCLQLIERGSAQACVVATFACARQRLPRNGRGGARAVMARSARRTSASPGAEGHSARQRRRTQEGEACNATQGPCGLRPHTSRTGYD